jgi:energy-coupling factor transporter ATP-binding protein EcfA2
MPAALEIADRAYVMELGEFVMSGSAKEISGDQRVVASYLGFQHGEESSSECFSAGCGPIRSSRRPGP